jgi:hypothetical protein
MPPTMPDALRCRQPGVVRRAADPDGTTAPTAEISLSHHARLCSGRSSGDDQALFPHRYTPLVCRRGRGSHGSSMEVGLRPTFSRRSRTGRAAVAPRTALGARPFDARCRRDPPSRSSSSKLRTERYRHRRRPEARLPLDGRPRWAPQVARRAPTRRHVRRSSNARVGRAPSIPEFRCTRRWTPFPDPRRGVDAACDSAW